MASRTTSSATAHDVGVRREAEELERGGWTVTARVDGWEDPDVVDGYVPDIVATRCGTVRLVEVETNPENARSRHAALREVAAARRAVFYAIEVDGNGRRVRYAAEL